MERLESFGTVRRAAFANDMEYRKRPRYLTVEITTSTGLTAIAEMGKTVVACEDGQRIFVQVRALPRLPVSVRVQLTMQAWKRR